MEERSERRPQLTHLPVGFQRFHSQKFINYQLNRAHALGYANRDRLLEAAGKIRNFEDCVKVFEGISAEAETEGKLRQATSYLRLAEFFTPQSSEAKIHTYKRYRLLFDRAFADAGATRYEVPYQGAALPAYRLPSTENTSRGTVLFHGGFDSLIEEFYVIWERIAAAGFDVIAFEGPGQGGARALGGLTFDHDWEKPVAAVLDHFNLEQASLIGLSMGGYWSIRAAGREPRIDRVVSWPPVYDWMHRMPTPMRAMARGMFRWRGFMNWSIRLRTRLVPVLRHVVDQAIYLVDGRESMDAVDWFLGMNAEHLGSDRVTQEVLLLSGENDTFQPPILTYKQAAALVNARSVDIRMFTEGEHADSHCQMGNLDLACGVVTTWLREGRLNQAPGGSHPHGTDHA
jgi:pimeloyl-ACP methyl ester carboxylesterase